MISKAVRDRLLAAICAVILCGILLLGLWPFTPHPRNQVAWLGTRDGLHFGDYGTILSATSFKLADSEAGAPCSLEIWAAPGQIIYNSTMLGFYGPERLVSFSLHQNTTNLLVQRQKRDQKGRASEVHLYVSDVFRQGKPTFVTLTVRAQKAVVYVDGKLVKSSSHFGLSREDFAGLLVVANSPVANDSWTGDLFGLALYDHELSPSEVMEHFNSWTTKGQPLVSEKQGPAALYSFDERGGSIIHNRAGIAPNLYIPDHFLIVHQRMLEVPWKEYHSDWSYYEDILINIGGFIPLGFVFGAYFSTVLHLKRAQFITILLGFMVSLTIEIAQAFIPTRDSGMTDVITNTTGTAIGLMLYRSKFQGRNCS